jgi:hypothetical protein
MHEKLIWEESEDGRLTDAAAWPLPVPTSQAMSRRGVLEAMKSKSSGGYTGRVATYCFACFRNRFAIDLNTSAE